MKNNKKVIIPLLSTVAGLSIVGGVSGAVAWYQYNTRVNASFIGSSVAESGVLQISRDGSKWGRDAYYDQDHPDYVQNFSPVTFGYTRQDNPKVIHANEALPDNDSVGNDTVAFAYPEAGHGSYDSWTKVTPGKEFIQYTIYLKALEVNNSPSATSDMKAASKEVFLSDIVLDGSKKMTAGENPTYNEEISKALRLHLSVKEDNVVTKNLLISKNGGNTTLFSDNLDLDADGERDRVGGYAWALDNNFVEYGTKDAVQEAYSIDEIKAVRDANGDFDFGPTELPEEAAAAEAKHDKQLICTTSVNNPVEITVTVWLEGWQELAGKDEYVVAKSQPQSEEDLENNLGVFFVKSGDEFVAATTFDGGATYYVRSTPSSLWDPRVTGSTTDFLSTLHVGMTFDVGKNAFKA